MFVLKFMKETLGYFLDPCEGLRLDFQLKTNEKLNSKISQTPSTTDNPFFFFTNTS